MKHQECKLKFVVKLSLTVWLERTNYDHIIFLPALWNRISIYFSRLDLDPHWECGSRRAKMTESSSAECSLQRAEGFSCRLKVLHVSLGINKLQFLVLKIGIFFKL